MLALLGDEELRQMGIATLGPRRRILAAIQASKPSQVGILLYLVEGLSVAPSLSTPSSSACCCPKRLVRVLCAQLMCVCTSALVMKCTGMSPLSSIAIWPPQL